MSKRLMPVLLVLLIAAAFLAACSPPATPTPTSIPPTAAMPMSTEGSMDMSNISDSPTVPAGLAYVDGQEIRFMHTEVSDPGVAEVLTKMMDSPVLVVPALAQAPDALLATVYVFKNGVKGMGPLGFQPDVFNNPPGSEGYSPLRKIVFITWKDESKARELKSLAEVVELEQAGELTLEASNVVVNMPFVTWPGGQR
ncbi:MAG: hypothetical protein H6Q04_686 [Acidobacteria bacterium]|nr:hypothetical protein [Acidobacteriota bacterium]